MRTTLERVHTRLATLPVAQTATDLVLHEA